MFVTQRLNVKDQGDALTPPLNVYVNGSNIRDDIAWLRARAYLAITIAMSCRDERPPSRSLGTRTNAWGPVIYRHEVRTEELIYERFITFSLFCCLA